MQLESRSWISFLIFACCCIPKISLTKMKFFPPVLSEEEQRSAHLPDNLKCDACKAVVNQFAETFSRAESKLKSGRLLKESEVLDLSEDLCRNGFQNYGVKNVDGVNRLSGPGLDTDNVPGVIQMGGKWPKRLQDTCSLLIGEVGEDEIFAAYKKNGDALYERLCLKENLAQALCRNMIKDEL